MNDQIRRLDEALRSLERTRRKSVENARPSLGTDKFLGRSPGDAWRHIASAGNYPGVIRAVAGARLKAAGSGRELEISRGGQRNVPPSLTRADKKDLAFGNTEARSQFGGAR